MSISYTPNPNNALVVNSSTNQLDLSTLLTQSNVSNLAISSVKIPGKYSNNNNNNLLTLTHTGTQLTFNTQNIKSSDLLALVIPTIDELALITSNSSTILTKDIELVGGGTDYFGFVIYKVFLGLCSFFIWYFGVIMLCIYTLFF